MRALLFLSLLWLTTLSLATAQAAAPWWDADIPADVAADAPTRILAEPPAAPEPPGHLRGIWVDAYGEGFKTSEEIDVLIEDARTLNLNALFVQVVRRGDCYCLRSSLPVSSDEALTPGFDPLAALTERAHAAGLQVHAWVVTLALWGSDAPPPDPAHAYNLHGPNAPENWLNVRYDGVTRPQGDVYLDPGVPAVADYLTEAVVSIVDNYNVDGVTFDRLRYPDFNEGSTPSWGYNSVSLARFAAETGEDGLPHPTDETWTAWRREQLSLLERRLYLGVKRADPNVWVGAATIAYGAPPERFADSHAYRVVLQDWAGWLEGGFLDLNLLMNYKRAADPEAGGWFEPWNRYAATLGGGGATAVATGMYLNDPAGTEAQAAAVAANTALVGWVGYSYRTPSDAVAAGWSDPQSVRDELAASLTASAKSFSAPAVFNRPPPVTALLGRVEMDGTQGGVTGAQTVELLDAGVVVATAATDASGHYGFVVAEDGDYLLRLQGGVAVPAPVRLGSVVTAPTLTRTWVAVESDAPDDHAGSLDP